jgi:hypothetical protein
MTYEINNSHEAALHISALDLYKEAESALDRGERLSLVVERHPSSGVRVETLIIHAEGGASGNIGRAGLACGGDCTWGDYIDDGDGGYIVTDDDGSILLLNGTESEEIE